MVFEKIKEMILEKMDIDPNSIKYTSLIVEDLNADSLDIIDVILAIEEEYNITVPEELVQDMRTVGDIVSFVENEIN